MLRRQGIRPLLLPCSHSDAQVARQRRSQNTSCQALASPGEVKPPCKHLYLAFRLASQRPTWEHLGHSAALPHALDLVPPLPRSYRGENPCRRRIGPAYFHLLSQPPTRCQPNQHEGSLGGSGVGSAPPAEPLAFRADGLLVGSRLSRAKGASLSFPAAPEARSTRMRASP